MSPWHREASTPEFPGNIVAATGCRPERAPPRPAKSRPCVGSSADHREDTIVDPPLPDGTRRENQREHRARGRASRSYRGLADVVLLHPAEHLEARATHRLSDGVDITAMDHHESLEVLACANRTTDVDLRHRIIRR